jgi:hypothetical protein
MVQTGFETVTNGFLNPPTNTEYVIVTADIGGDVRWRDDGTASTATVGHIIYAGKSFRYKGKINRFYVFGTAAVTYYAPDK